MVRFLKKFFALIMAVALLFASAPLSGFTGLITKASAYDVNWECTWLHPKESSVGVYPGEQKTFIIEWKSDILEEEKEQYDVNGTLVIPFFISVYDNFMFPLQNVSLTTDAITAGATLTDETVELFGDDSETLATFFGGTIRMPARYLDSAESLDVINVTIGISKDWDVDTSLSFGIDFGASAPSMADEAVKVVSANGNEVYVASAFGGYTSQEVYADTYTPTTFEMIETPIDNNDVSVKVNLLSGWINEMDFDFICSDGVECTSISISDECAGSVDITTAAAEISQDEKYAKVGTVITATFSVSDKEYSIDGDISNFKSKQIGSIYDTVAFLLNKQSSNLKVCGEGEMCDVEDNWRVSHYCSHYYDENSIKTAEIEDGITHIGDYAFYDCSSLAHISIPDSVTSIGDYAFADCSSLARISIPDSVTSIGKRAFRGCKSLDDITLPNNLRSIGDYAFADCLSLTYIEIPENVTEDIFLFGTFENCCKLKEAVILGDFYAIRDTFADCVSLESVTLPDNIMYIFSYSFFNCVNLSEINIPNGVETIDPFAFYGCVSLKDLTVPEDTRLINDYSFAFVTNLNYNGDLDISNCRAKAINGYVDGPLIYSDSSKTKLLACVADYEGTIEIPDSVTAIGEGAFAFCTRLTDIIIPDSVIYIEDGAFSYCTGLKSITVPDSIAYIGSSAFEMVSNVIYNGNLTDCFEDAKAVNGYADGSFIYSDSSKTKILACSSSISSSVIIPDTVTEIGDYAFNGCYNLKVYVPDTVESFGDIQDDTFYEYEILAGKGIEIFYEASEEQWDSNYYESWEDLIVHYNYTDSVIGISVDIPPEKTKYHQDSEFDSTGMKVNLNYDFSKTEINNYSVSYDFSKVGDTFVSISYSLNDVEYETQLPVTVEAHQLTHLTIPSSCSGAGSEFDICAVCGKQFNVNVIPALEHNLTHICIDATCTRNGEEYDICSVCGNMFNIIETPVLEHSIEHVFIDSTCTENGIKYDYCTYCGQKFNETVIPAEHKTTHVSVQKNCTTDGEEYDICSVCGQVLNHTVEKAQGHNYTHIVVPSSCTANGMEFDYCLVCGNQANLSVLPASHIWGNWQISVYPTTISDGKSERICEKCGAKENKTLAKTISNCVIEENKIYGLTAGMTVDSFTTNNLAVNGVTVSTTPSDGNSMGTGSKVALTYPDGETVEYEVVIFGDTNGDAWYDGTDSIIVNCLAVGMLSKAQVGESVYTAADCNHDGTIDENDVALLEQAGLALSGVDQSKSEAELMTDSVFIDYLNLIDQNPFEEEISDNTPSADELPNITADKAEKPSFIQKIIDFIVYVLRIMRSFIPQL